jgi:hypothetical protein
MFIFFITDYADWMISQMGCIMGFDWVPIRRLGDFAEEF